MINYFLDAITVIEHKAGVPYYLDSKIIDLHPFLSIRDKSDILSYIINKDEIEGIFRYFSKTQALSSIFPYLGMLRYIPQNKGKSKNAFDHTLRVLRVIPSDNIVLRWSGLFHDLGKYDSYMKRKDFRGHEAYSHSVCEGCCQLYSIPEADKICSIVKNHMSPLDYQRRPDWSDDAIRRFIGRCGKEHAIDTIEFAYYDKKAENDVPEFLKIITDFRSKVKEILDDKD